MTATEAQTQVHPGIANFYAIFTDMRRRRSDLDLVEVGAFFRHRFLRVDIPGFWSSDHGYVTKGRNHSQEPLLSLRMILEVLHTCCGLIISLVY